MLFALLARKAPESWCRLRYLQCVLLLNKLRNPCGRRLSSLIVIPEFFEPCRSKFAITERFIFIFVAWIFQLNMYRCFLVSVIGEIATSRLMAWTLYVITFVRKCTWLFLHYRFDVFINFEQVFLHLIVLSLSNWYIITLCSSKSSHAENTKLSHAVVRTYSAVNIP